MSVVEKDGEKEEIKLEEEKRLEKKEGLWETALARIENEIDAKDYEGALKSLQMLKQYLECCQFFK